METENVIWLKVVLENVLAERIEADDRYRTCVCR